MPHRLLYAPSASRKAVAHKPAPDPASAAPAKGGPTDWAPVVAALRAGLTGSVLTPADAQYATARKLWDARFDPHPAAIALCADEADVRAALAVARKFGAPFRVRSGGHSFAGFSAADGLVIDVAALDSVTVHPKARTATVGTGCPASVLNPALQNHGLYVPLGDWPDVRIGGFMQGGGAGLTSRTHGMNCDHVIGVRVMLADGTIVEAKEGHNEDLFWAVRGGTGGQFGVLLTITYRLFAFPGIVERTIGWPLATPTDCDRAAAVMMEVQHRFARGNHAPKLNLTGLVLWSNPATGGGPPTPYLVFDAHFAGAQAECDAALAPLLAMPGAIADFLPHMVQRPGPIPAIARAARFVDGPLDPAQWGTVLSSGLGAPNKLAVLYIECQGHAINAVPKSQCAYIHRDAAFNIWFDVMWTDDTERDAELAFQHDWCATMAPFWNGLVYQNFPSEDLAHWRRNYWGDAFEALAAVKLKYDPDGVFDFPQAARMRHGETPHPSWPPRVVAALRHPIVGP